LLASERPSDSEAPQSPQNLNEGVFSAPHCGHLAESADPHPPQNFFPAGFSVAHFEQRISASPARPCGRSDARSYPRIRKSARNTKACGFELSAWAHLGLRVVDRGRLN
jgi:hypothetical protein